MQNVLTFMGLIGGLHGRILTPTCRYHNNIMEALMIPQSVSANISCHIEVTFHNNIHIHNNVLWTRNIGWNIP